MRDSKWVVVDPVSKLIYVIGVNRTGPVDSCHSVTDIARRYFGLTAPAVVLHRLPTCGAPGSHGIPHGGVVAEVVGEIGAAPGLIERGNAEVAVEVAEVDNVRAAAEGAEGRGAGGDLGGGREGREQEKNKKQIPRCARDDNGYVVGNFHRAPNRLADTPLLSCAVVN